MAALLAAIRMVAQKDLGISAAAAPSEQAAMACPDGQHSQSLQISVPAVPVAFAGFLCLDMIIAGFHRITAAVQDAFEELLGGISFISASQM